MKRTILTLAFLLILSVGVYAQTRGNLLWDYKITDVANVSSFQVCINDVCTDVGLPGRTDNTTTGIATFKSPIPTASVSTGGVNTFKVEACNVIACVSSTTLTISPPVGVTNIRIAP